MVNHVDIEIDSGVEVSSLLASIGTDSYPQNTTRLSMCGGHHVAAENCMSSAPGSWVWRLQTCEAMFVNLLVRFRVINIGEARWSTQDLSRCGWQTVFLLDWKVVL